ncbi:uncharacterized protein LOC133795507 [Humulus lupulus]|uniref:uncharacterized protein LOC133795507 n=1 Tax=Humulus lupulus TaxID=3486 RepID=UPI002B414D3C|nr:uncharacterized protein LOC133795507 [Humulus lupulus]
MAKGARNEGKAKAKGKVKKVGPSSSDRIIKTRSTDAIVGVQELEILKVEEGDYEHLSKTSIRTCGEKSNGLAAPLNQGRKIGIKTEPEDIAEEISYWQPSIVCYVVGANPPVNILDGFVRVLDGGYLFFGKKPLVMKPWNSVDDFTKEDITIVPTWIQLGGLDIKYWGEGSLFKIMGQIGRPIQVDNFTKHRDRLYYPRILIEVSMDQEFPTTIGFMNEFDQEIELQVEYEWIPIVCHLCSGIGHETKMSRKETQVKKTWVPGNW